MKMDLSRQINGSFRTGDDTERIMKKTIDELATIVVSTMGPNGSTVIIPDSKEAGKYTITKDGVSIVDAYVTDNKYGNIVLGLVKQIAKETVKEAGDGTTTSILLAQLFMNSTLTFDESCDDDIERIITNLKASAKEMGVGDVFNIAKVSANGDNKIAKNIADTYRSKNSTVTIKKGNTDVDVVNITQGYYLPNGSMVDIIPVRNHNNAKLLITNEHLTDLGRYSDILKRGTSSLIVIIAPHVDDTFHRVVRQNNLKVIFVKAPGFADHRENLLNDLANACDTEVTTIHDKVIPLSRLVDITDVSCNSTELFFKIQTEDKLKTVIESLNSKLKLVTEDYDIELLKQRISRLTGEVSTISIGGLSEAEQNERYDRYEDAILAVKCAYEDGYIKGGGVGLREVLLSTKINNEELITLLETPYNKLSKNERMYDMNTLSPLIIDPVKVTITALVRSYNFIKVLKQTKSIVL